jgi:POT family proton-dependent oligopeptide transporter
MFWAGFEQAGSSLNLFADRYTDRFIGDFEMPASWLQSVNPVMIILIAPLFAALWAWLAGRNLEPSTPVKFGLGLVLLGVGFGVMFVAARLVAAGNPVLPVWLITTYLFHTLGELALSPVGLSATTKLAPRRYVGQMMGVWFVGAALGNVLAGLLAGELAGESVSQMPGLYLQIVMTSVGSGIVMLICTPLLKKLMGDVH